MGSKMSIKVCHITSVHQRYDTRIFHKECTSLANAGYDVTLLVADGKKDEVRNGVKIVSTDYVPTSRYRRILLSGHIMFKAARQIDAEIYHLHDPELLPLGKKLKRCGKKVIFDSHENYPAQIACKQYLPKTLRWCVSKIYRHYETGALKKYDAVVAPCTFFGGTNIFEGRCKRTKIISNALLLNEFYDKYDHALEKNGNAICHVGGLTYERGITHLIKAAYKAGVKLILAGKFSPEGYHEQLKKMPEYQCVDYRGFLPREELLRVYKESSAGIATILNIGQYNTGDNFATKVYEYMSMGLPVILSKYKYAKDVLSELKFGLVVNPSDIEEIANAICFLRNNPNITAEMGANGRKAVITEFNWEVEVKKLLELYINILTIDN